MRRPMSRALSSLFAVALALPLVVPGAAAFAQTEGTIEWISQESGDIGGRELPAVSADGRYVVFVGRSSSDMGVWVRDRTAGETHQVTSGSHFNPAISADGRTVAYAQYGGASQGIYVLDWKTSTTPQLVSVGDDGEPAGVPVDFPALSGNGRYVAFQASVGTLDDDALPGKSGGGPNKVYVHDRQSGDTEMVSVTSDGEIVNGNANRPDITPDGRYVVFSSDASVLAGEGETEEPTSGELEPLAEEEEATVVHVYRHDRQTGETAMASVASDGTPGDGGSALAYGPTVSDDGSKVAFESDSTNLVADDTNGNTDAFVHDFVAGTTERISLDANGDEAVLENPQTTAEAAGDEGADPTSNAGAGPAISGNGRYVAFESDAALTPDDVNTPDPVEYNDGVPVYTTDVYMVDLTDGTLVRSSAAVGEDAVEATGLRTDGTGVTSAANNGADPAINVDGRLIAFVSNGNLNGELPPPEEEGEESPAPAEEPGDAVLLWEPEVWARTDGTTPGDPGDPGDPGGSGGGTITPPFQWRFNDIADNIHAANIEAIAALGITRGCNPAGDMYCPKDPVTRGQAAAFLERALNLAEAEDDYFIDDEGSIFEADINALAEAGITKGCSVEGDEYCPDDQLTRGQVAALLRRAFDVPEAQGDYFIDDEGSIFEADINALAEAGITKGWRADFYAPDLIVLRDQMASFLARALGLD